MSQGEGFPQHHQAVLRTLAEHPTIQLSSDTIYPEVAQTHKTTFHIRYQSQTQEVICAPDLPTSCYPHF